MSPTLSALVVVAPEAEPVVGAHRLTLDPSARAGVPAHLTVLFPFVAPTSIDETVVARLRAVLGGVAPFTVTLSRTGWFGDDVLHLAPEDPAPFVALTEAVARAFPEHPPYEGRFDEVVPHLTVGEGAPLPALRAGERAVAEHLPIIVAVTEVVLMVGGGTAPWQIVHRLPLGTD